MIEIRFPDHSLPSAPRCPRCGSQARAERRPAMEPGINPFVYFRPPDCRHPWHDVESSRGQ